MMRSIWGSPRRTALGLLGGVVAAPSMGVIGCAPGEGSDPLDGRAVGWAELESPMLAKLPKTPPAVVTLGRVGQVRGNAASP